MIIAKSHTVMAKVENTIELPIKCLMKLFQSLKTYVFKFNNKVCSRTNGFITLSEEQ